MTGRLNPPLTPLGRGTEQTCPSVESPLGRGTGQTRPRVESPPGRGQGWGFQFQAAAVRFAASLQSEVPLTLILSPLRAGSGEVERTRLESLFRAPNTVPPKGSPLPLEKGEGQGEGSSRPHGYLLNLLETCVPRDDAGRSSRSSCYDR